MLVKISVFFQNVFNFGQIDEKLVILAVVKTVEIISDQGQTIQLFLDVTAIDQVFFQAFSARAE